MSDTIVQECIMCGYETDCIEGVCQVCALEAERPQTNEERYKAVLLQIRNGEWDEECETKEGLREAYTYVPRSLIEKALKGE